MAIKRVLFFIGTPANRIGGIETFVREAAIQLSEQGIDTVAVFHTEPTPAVLRFFDVDGLTVESLPQLTDNLWIRNKAVRSLLKRHRPDIVHWQFLDALSPIPWLSWFYGARQVFFTNQSSYAEGHNPGHIPLWKRLLARLINRHLTGMFCVSDYCKRVSIAARKLPAERIHRIYSGITPPCLKETAERGILFRRSYGIPDKAPMMLQVSWLIPEKGIEDLLQAAKLVLNRHPDARFVIAGEGRDHAMLARMAEDLGIAQSVIWAGFLESPTQVGVYDAADILCQFSRWEEAFGLVIAEGMSFAKPVVATRVGGIPEVVTEGVTGLLGPRRDPKTAAENICRLLDDPDMRRKFGEASRRAVEEKFTVTDRVRDMLRYYDVPQESSEYSQESEMNSQTAKSG